MKKSKEVIFILIALIVTSALYRIIPGRPYGFAPQIAIALFSGALIKDKFTAFAVPVLSMLVSDAIFELLYVVGISPMWGFYEGQLTNYILFALLTSIGFFITRITPVRVAVASVTAPTIYFLLSNLLVWMSGGGLLRPKTWNGLMMSYADGLPFYVNSVVGTLFFAGIFFGAYHIIKNHVLNPRIAG